MKPSIISITVRVIFKEEVHDIVGYDDGIVLVKKLYYLGGSIGNFKMPVTKDEKRLEEYYRENFY